MDFWGAGHNLEAGQRKWLVRIVVGVSVILVGLVGVLSGMHAVSTVPMESPNWETSIQLRLILAKLFVAMGLVPLGIFLAVTAHAAFSKTEKARRLWTWAPSDTAIVKAQKTANSGNFLNALVISIILGLLFGVLR